MRGIEETCFILIEKTLVALNNFCNISNASIIKESLKLVALSAVNQMFNHSLNHLLVLALSQGLHCRSNDVELLLQVVKANSGVNLVPILHFHVLDG